MKWTIVLLCLYLSCVSATNWAVIVAGSNYYYNYRHQADACHAYQIVAKNGILSENIIMLYFDDIANDPDNPYPGKLFNKPTLQGVPGVDVYENCQKDYTGNDVTAANFMNILTGNAAAMKGIGTGKVLQSTSDDNVFINFVDHGGPGLIAFPTGPYLYSNDLNTTLITMYQNQMYKKLVFYMEACESGSMFENILPTNINIYATTASNSDESSWGTYCPPDDFVNGVEINSCLGDTYSINWMEDADKQSPSMDETLEAQFEVVKNETDQSHVCQWGELDWTTDAIGTFEGESSKMHTHKHYRTPHSSSPKRNSVNARDIKLNYLYFKYLRADKTNLVASHQAALELEAEVQHRVQTDLFFEKLARSLGGSRFDDIYHNSAHFIGYTSKCYRLSVEAIEKGCGRLSDYALGYLRVVANLCAHFGHDGTRSIISKINEMCVLNK